jgi:hypothetical protein
MTLFEVMGKQASKSKHSEGGPGGSDSCDILFRIKDKQEEIS